MRLGIAELDTECDRGMSGAEAGHQICRSAPNRIGQLSVRVVVRDTGPGSDSKYLERHLEPFYTTKFSGAMGAVGANEPRGRGISVHLAGEV
jgi:signal transduction histidine kinase